MLVNENETQEKSLLQKIVVEYLKMIKKKQWNPLCSLGITVSETTRAHIDTSGVFYYLTARKRQQRKFS